MSENLENRISSEQAKDAIYKAHSISSSASEIDNAIFSSSFKKGTYIEKFDSTVGFTNTFSSTSSMNILTEVTPYGNSCMELKANVVNTELELVKTVNPTSILQAKYVSLYIYTTNIGDFGSCVIKLHSEPTPTVKKLEYSFAPKLLGSNKWYNLKIPISYFTQVGGMLLTNVVNSISFRVYPATGKSAYFKLAGLVIDNFERPAISFTFDDCQDSDYTIAYAKMKPYGIKGTIFTVSEAVGLVGRPTIAQYKEMYNDGWHFGIHGKDALNWTTEQTVIQADASIKTCRDWLHNNGFVGIGLKSCAYPQGKFTSDTINSLLKYGITYARTTIDDYNHFPLVENMEIRGKALSSISANNKAYVDEVVAKGGHLVFITHVISGNLITAYNELIDYIVSKDYVKYCTTLPDWYENYNKLINRV